MLVCEKHKVIFVDVPKTASRSIYNVLLNHYGARRLTVHGRTTPNEYKHFFSFCVVRNPYERVCSMYWSMCQRKGDKQGYCAIMKQKGMKNTLESFLTIIQAQPKAHNLPQYCFYENNKIKQVLRYETLQDDWDTLPFLTEPITLPHSNATVGEKRTRATTNERPHWREMINKKSGNKVNKIFKRDFELFNYTMETFT